MHAVVQAAVLSAVPEAAQAAVQAAMQAPMIPWTTAIPPLAATGEGPKTSSVAREGKTPDAEVGATSLGGLVRKEAARKSSLQKNTRCMGHS